MIYIHYIFCFSPFNASHYHCALKACHVVVNTYNPLDDLEEVEKGMKIAKI